MSFVGAASRRLLLPARSLARPLHATVVAEAPKKRVGKDSSFGPVDDPEVEPRFLEMVKMFFDQAAALTNIEDGRLQLMKECNSVIRAYLCRRGRHAALHADSEISLICCLRTFSLDLTLM